MLVESTEKKLRQYHMIEPGQTVAVALSGGQDSICLLHVLKQLEKPMEFQLTAVHVHHGLRQEADEDERFCRSLCRSWQIPLTVYHVDVPAQVAATGESIEEAARRLRYAAFQRLPVQRIALAHHQQDQAETLLLNLLRGSGLSGLCGMQAVRLPYIRPFLEVPKETITAYIKESHLTYVEDASNQNTAFRRNRIRRQLLPLLQQDYNAEIVRTLAQTAARLQEEDAYLEAATPDVESTDLSIEWVQSYSISIQKRILRKWLAKAGLMQDVSQVHLDQLLELMKGRTGRRISLPKGLTVDKTYDILHIYRSMPDSLHQQEMPSFQMEFLPVWQARQQWSSPEQVPALPEEKWLEADHLSMTPVWRRRQAGDYIMAAGGRKKLKDFFIDEKIPRQEREQLPLLTDGSHVLWVLGYRISDGVRITENTQRVLHVRRV